MRSREIYWLILILLLTGLASWINFAPENQFLGRDVSIRLGLDLQGGTQVLLQATDPNVDRELVETARGVIDQRVNGLGVSEALVQRSGDNRIIVELPGVANPDQAIETLRGTGKLEFIDPQGQFLQNGQQVRTSGSPDLPQPTTPVSGTAAVSPTIDPTNDTIFQAITDGKDLDTGKVQLTTAGQGSLGNEPAVAFTWLGASATQLAQFSAQNVNKPMCIVLDNVVQSCPVINSALVDGSGIITTQSREDAQRIFNQLKYGALPVALQIETSRTVTATLGDDSVQSSIVAGTIGLAAVALFMLLFYRLPGLLADIALLIYTLIVFAFYRYIPITLTLAGIAGFILSIGLAVDANVLIFARLKEELRHGRSLRMAVEAAFNEAWPAIRDSNVATLITCTILYLFGNSFAVSIIKGFALTLGLGIVISMFTAVVVTRTLLRIVVDLNITNPWLYGLDREADRNVPGERQAA